MQTNDTFSLNFRPITLEERDEIIRQAERARRDAILGLLKRGLSFVRSGFGGQPTLR